METGELDVAPNTLVPLDYKYTPAEPPVKTVCEIYSHESASVVSARDKHGGL